MKSMFENLNSIVANTVTDSIKMIDIDDLHKSEDNFFQLERIEEFAETILGQGGVKDNLIVRPLKTGGYEIISGHRRTEAVRYLLEKGKNVSRYLPCLVQNYENEDDKLLDIVLMNVSARQLSDAELWKSYEIVDNILKSKKSAGEKFGRVREKLAECLGISPAQVGKIQNIDKNAVNEVKEAVKKGDISISTANEIAKLDEQEQQEIILQSEDLSEISHKDVKEKREKKKQETNIESEKVDICINKDIEADKDGDIRKHGGLCCPVCGFGLKNEVLFTGLNDNFPWELSLNCTNCNRVYPVCRVTNYNAVADSEE